MGMPKFVIYPDKAGEYRWRLIAPNGEIVASGEGYATPSTAIEGINAVARSAATAIVLKDDQGIEVLDAEEAESAGYEVG